MNRQYSNKAVFVTAATLFAAPALATELTGTPDELRNYLRADVRTVSLHEEATEKAYSDIANVTLIVKTEARDLESAMEANKNMRQTVIGELRRAGVAEDDIKSAKYSASPQFGWFGDEPSKYEVVNSLTVKIDSEAEFHAAAGIADNNESVKFGSVEFEHSEKEAYEDKVRDKALQAVLDNADYFKERLGMELRPVAFGYSDVYSQPGRVQLEQNMLAASRAPSSIPLKAAAGPGTGFDEIEYRVSVSVTFEIVTAQ